MNCRGEATGTPSVALLKADKDGYHVIQAVAESGDEQMVASFPAANIKGFLESEEVERHGVPENLPNLCLNL